MANTPGEKAKSTIVIKRIKKAAHGAHGAAWKIAYADFVTAMMAFFLLMWLLGSTTKGDLKGISEYFQSPLQVAMSGGSRRPRRDQKACKSRAVVVKTVTGWPGDIASG